MKTSEKGIITGIFKTPESAERAYNNLREKGYSDGEIHLVMSETSHKEYSSEQKKAGSTESAIISFVAALSTFIPVPGIGMIMTGPIAASLAEDGVEGQPEEFVPALIGFGVPANYAKEYESKIQNGHILMGFHPHNREDAHYFAEEWNTLNAGYIYRRPGVI